jgi:hypothetical protein
MVDSNFNEVLLFDIHVDEFAFVVINHQVQMNPLGMVMFHSEEIMALGHRNVGLFTMLS